MVTLHRKSGFLRREDGVAMTEALLVFPIFMLVFGAMVEFGAMMYQFNQAAKAMQVGARRAAVSDPLVTDLSAFSDYSSEADPPNQGEEVPATPVTVSCGYGTTPCDATELSRLMTGGDGQCGKYASGFLGVCDVAAFIKSENIKISYHRSGLGYVGRPQGPVVTITLEVRNLTFDFFLLDDLLPGLGSISIPIYPVSVSSEDLSSTSS